MSIRKSVMAALVLAGLCVSISAQAAAVYRMICRGGHPGNTSMSIASYPSTNGISTNVSYYFARYQGPAANVKQNGSHLAPGECSWATGVLGSQYFRMDYYQTPSSVSHISGMYFNNDQDNNLVVDTSTQINVDRNDPNQAFIPFFNNGYLPPEEVAGTILDENRIFSFYVTVNKYNVLVLQYLR